MPNDAPYKQWKMKRQATITERVLHFKQPAGTSRGVYTERKIWLVTLTDGERTGRGECAPLPDLSCDASPDYEATLRRFCDVWEQADGSEASLQLLFEQMRNYPSMLFGLETAVLSMTRGQRLFDTAFSRGEEGIPINGLVWMGSHKEMLQRMEQKLEQGYSCIKLKIGAIDFERELDLVRRIRQRFSHRVIQLRLDANGAFPYEEALYKMELLSQYAIHSIEQPIKAGQWAFMAELCRDSPLPVALDEELVGVNDTAMKAHMLNIIKPAYIVLKPSLHGGMSGCREWAQAARQHGVGSWMTSALESNVGLDAIAQFCSDLYGDHITIHQGLGTGQLFTDNIPMPLQLRGDRMWRDGEKEKLGE